jgi:hypothetical protein
MAEARIKCTKGGKAMVTRDNETTDNETTDNETTDNETTDNETTDNETTKGDSAMEVGERDWRRGVTFVLAISKNWALKVVATSQRKISRLGMSISRVTLKIAMVISAFRDEFSLRIRKLIIDERGDVPGWVLVVLMTTGLVTGIWTIAAPRIESLLRGSLDSMNSVR